MSAPTVNRNVHNSIITAIQLNEMIAAAYTAARDRASIRYCNGILKNWFNSGYKKVEDIVGYGAKPEKVSEEDFLLGDIAQLGLFE